MMQVVQTSEPPTQGFGTVEIGNHPKQYDKEGLLVFVVNYTNVRNLVDPNRPQVLYIPNLSCATEPVQACNASSTLPTQEIQCLGIVNPNSHETKFSASISFDKSAVLPILTIPPSDSSPTSSSSSSSSSSSPTSTDTSSFLNLAHRTEIIDFGYLLIMSLSFSIFISIFSTFNMKM